MIYLGNKQVGISHHKEIINTASVSLESLNITQNGYYTAPSGTAYNSITVNAAPTLTPGTLRPDIQSVVKYTYDKKLIADNILESLPAYTTTSTTLVANGTLSDTIAVDYNYNYYILERFLTIPIYNSTVEPSRAKGRVEYHIASYIYEFNEIPANNFITLSGDKTYTSRAVDTVGYGITKLFYWSSGTAVAVYNTAAYGVCQPVAAPSISSSKFVIKYPSVLIRGNTTYFTQTFFDGLSDIRVQYIIELFKAPKNNLNLDGWNNTTQCQKILNAINNNNKTLI